MVTTGAKYFFGITAFALLAAVVYGMSTYGDPVGMDAFLGAITFGYKGGVGDHVGYSILVGLAAGSGLLGVISSAVRDADPKALAEVAIGPEAPEEAAPVAQAPVGVNWWPAVLAFGVAIMVIGLVSDQKVFVFGLVVVAVAGLEWAVRAWSERATGDPLANRTLRHRFLNPLELPLFAASGIAFFAVALSRLLLSSTEHVATIIFGAVPAVVLLIAVLLNARPHTARAVIGGLLGVGAVLILAAGVVGLVRGEEHAVPEHKGDHFKPYVIPSGGPQGLAPLHQGATITVEVSA
jgi:hypothetical protein